MKDNYNGRLSQRERWNIWEQSIGKPMGSYERMRDQAEYNKALEEYNRTHFYKL